MESGADLGRWFEKQLASMRPGQRLPTDQALAASWKLSPRTVRRVMVPLLRPTMLSVWIWTSLLVYREMTAAVFLISQDNVTLPAIVWGRWTQGAPTQAAAITVLMMVALLPLLFISWRFARRSRLSADI